MHHIGAVESAPPSELKRISFPVKITGELSYGEYFEDGQNRCAIQAL